MPRLTRDDLYHVGYEVIRAIGAPDGHASTVASHLADANLTGHDSHGIIRIPQYVENARKGWIEPNGEPEIVADTPTTARVDGHHTFGQVVGGYSARVAIDKAKNSGISLVTMSSLSHIGRIGSYTEMAANEGMAAIMFTGILGEGGFVMAPFGGKVARLSSNPITMSFPYKPDSPILLDFATTIGAEGKLRIYRARGQKLPEEWVLDSDGSPSRDPNDFYNGGAVLPIGGIHGGHKGYALAMMAATLGGILGEFGKPPPADGWYTSGSTIIVIDVSALAPLDKLTSDVDGLVQLTKDTPLMEGAQEILYPGEKEAKTRHERLVSGVEVEDATWEQITGLIMDFGLESKLGRFL